MENTFQEIFSELKKYQQKYNDKLVVKADTDEKYVLYTNHLWNGKDPLYFGGVEIKKNYVSYHLMAFYMFPELLNDVDEKLLKRMQGKSCFNFKKVDVDLFKELQKLTDVCYKKYKKEKYV